jgi:hypothetical protein
MAKQDGTEQAETPRPAGPTGPSRVLARDISVYYSNCAMVATTPRDISMFFGRLVPTSDEKGGQTLAELYERQIYMTIEQAEDLAKMLTQTVANFKTRKTPGAPTQ